ncbi:protein aig1-like [Plakobranchus ocellatus]|uniref:Protein aig1-like n=1 Tax=Plakobranchus ocellatus TaxID=259542 RepID=A0AAV4CZA1_9GAST|nr:protein aig1-like [Plakobranchus ocellatus]
MPGMKVKDCPPYRPFPSPKWLLSVCVTDVFSRLEELKSAVTSTLSNILKMDSTKRVTKKLAGTGSSTAAWLTNVGNEHGQERPSLKCFTWTGTAVASSIPTQGTCFPQQHGLVVRLDIWHFMRRLASCVSSESHPLYATFMSKLSSCIFRWDEDDVAALRRTKSIELQSCGLDSENPQLSPAELATHCRRETRGAAETEALIDKLLTSLMGSTGLETLGVPLFDNRISTTWEQQRGHLVCIQDLLGVSLYRREGGLALPVYRCARGSTSLESFHLHINRFTPGESASCANFQAYMLEGIVRWNKDRRAAALCERTCMRCYSYELQHAVSRAAAPLQLDPGVNLPQPARFTGELIGVEYLLAQTGQPMGPLPREGEEEEEEEEAEQGTEESPEEEETVEAELVDLTVPPAPEPLEVSPSPPTLQEATSHPPVLLTSPRRLQLEVLSSEAVLEEIAAQNVPSVECKDPDGRGGYDKVMALARFLVSLRLKDALNNAEAQEVIKLFNNLAEADKSKIKYPPRHRMWLTGGHFGKAKSSVVHGTESVKS